ncbi:MAG: hypothetical protein Q9212_003598 [Teloschistes hypoglaucus]
MFADVPQFHAAGIDLHGDQRGRIIGACSAIVVLATIFIILRLFSRRLARWDDYLAVAAWLLALGPSIAMFFALRYGYGRHIYLGHEQEQSQDARQFFKIFWITQLFFTTSIAFAKCAIQPIHAAWDRALGLEPKHCINNVRFLVASGSVNVGLNAIVFALPIPLLWRLRISTRQHIILTAIFTLAGFVVLVSIIWVVVLSRVKSEDITWSYINVGIWGALEPSLGVICACIPSLRPLFRFAAHGFSKPSHYSSSKDKFLPNNMKRRTWPGSITKVSDGKFSQISEQQEDTAPFGHGVEVHGGGVEPGRDGIELPEHGISVKTEITVTTVGLEYRDRLY